jgi:pimeloyl-ACP methyl ester carboxylesterase
MLKARLPWLCIVLLAAPVIGATGESIDIVVPLQDARFYSLHALLKECNLKLGTNHRLDAITDRRMELTPFERAALLLADGAGLLKARFERDRIVISVPDSQDDRVRRQVRDRLGRLFGVPLNEWPVKFGLHLPKDFDPARRTVLLTHGLEAGTESLRPMQMAFEHWGAQVLLFDFPNDGPIAWSGDRLSKELGELVERYPKMKLAVVAHSMGGLVVRYAVEMPGKNSGCVTDVFLLGTPNAGSRLASVQPWLEVFQEVLPQPHRLFDTVTDGLGEAADDLQPGSRFLAALNARGRAADVRYYSIMGRKSVVSENQRAVIEREMVEMFKRRTTPDDIQRRILDALRSDELREGRGDGAVALSSARLDGTRAEKVVDLNHMQLLLPLEEMPEDGEVFHWIVETLGWQRSGK